MARETMALGGLWNWCEAHSIKNAVTKPSWTRGTFQKTYSLLKMFRRKHFHSLTLCPQVFLRHLLQLSAHWSTSSISAIVKFLCHKSHRRTSASRDEWKVETVGEASAHRWFPAALLWLPSCNEDDGRFSVESSEATSAVMFPKSRVNVSFPRLWKNLNMNYLHMSGRQQQLDGEGFGDGEGMEGFLHKKLGNRFRGMSERKIKGRALRRLNVCV